MHIYFMASDQHETQTIFFFTVSTIILFENKWDNITVWDICYGTCSQGAHLYISLYFFQ